MDLRYITATAIRNFEAMAQLPFLNDSEVSLAFGDEVAGALMKLDAISQNSRVCRSCGGRCCRQMRCEVFAPELGCCPIFELRPLLCRFNYCHEFGAEWAPLARWLIEVIAEAMASLTAQSAAARGLELNAALYGECRSPGETVPEIALKMRAHLEKARAGAGTLLEARAAMLGEVEAYRSLARDCVHRLP